MKDWILIFPKHLYFMTYLWKKLSFLLLLLSCLNCVDEIELIPEKDRLKAIAINGKIGKGEPSVISVLVSPVFTFSGDSRAITPVDEVYLQNEEGQKYIIEDRVAVGQYRQVIDPSFEITYDQKYQLTVQLSDGRVYESAFVEVLPSIPIQSLGFEIVQQDRFNPITNRLEARNFIQYKISTPLVQSSNNDKVLLRWDALKTTRYQTGSSGICYTTQAVDVNYIGLFNGNSLSSDTLINFQLVNDFIDESFSDTYYLSVLQENLPEAAYQYWNQVNLSIKRTGNMFEPVAGLVSTNIRNTAGEKDEVQGFFYATEQDTFNLRICPRDIGLSFSSQTCGDFNMPCPCPTTIPPSFWVNCN